MSDTTPKCPLCDGLRTKRTNRATEEPFYGCMDYPNCKGTRPFESEEDNAPRFPSERFEKKSRRYE